MNKENNITVKLYESPLKQKKYRAVFYQNGKEFKYTDFGSSKGENYTDHNDKQKKENYLKRHKKNEDWNDPYSAGALSRWVTWEYPSLKKGWTKYKEKFNFK